MKSLLCFFVLLTSVVLCQASPINFESLVGQTVALTVEPYASGENNGSYYVGLTQGVIDGQTFYMFCNDFEDEITVPTTYDVTVVSLLGSAFTSDSLGLSLAQLQQQATLGLNFGTTPSGNNQADSDTQQAIWNYTGANYARGYGGDAGNLSDQQLLRIVSVGRYFRTRGTGLHAGCFDYDSRTSVVGAVRLGPVDFWVVRQTACTRVSSIKQE